MDQTKKYIHESVRLLKEMIAIPSLSFHEDEVCSHICSFLDSCGIIHYREKNNIIALNRHFDPTHKSLMLNAHIDTVPPGTEYSFDPYEPDYSAAAETIPADPAKRVPYRMNTRKRATVSSAVWAATMTEPQLSR